MRKLDRKVRHVKNEYPYRWREVEAIKEVLDLEQNKKEQKRNFVNEQTDKHKSAFFGGRRPRNHTRNFQ